MATWQYELAPSPHDPRALELWLQHVAGCILFEDVRGYAMERIDPHLPPKARAAVEKGIDDALYGLMMVLDGVTGGIENATHRAQLRTCIQLVEKSVTADPQVVREIDLAEGDGMCMGYHGWREGDFGSEPTVTLRSDAGRDHAPS